MPTKYVLLDTSSFKLSRKKKKRKPKPRPGWGPLGDWETKALGGGGMMDMPKLDLVGAIQKRRDPVEQLKRLRHEEKMERTRAKVDKLQRARAVRQAKRRSQQIQQFKSTFKQARDVFGRLRKKKSIYD